MIDHRLKVVYDLQTMKENYIPVFIPVEEAQALLRLSRRIGGHIGGARRSAKQEESARRNIQRATAARNATKAETTGGSR